MKKIIIFLLVITMLLPVVAACTDKAAEKVKVINVFKSESISLPDGFSASGKMAYVDGRILIQGYVYDEYYNYKQVIYSVNEDGSDGKEILLMDNTREENYNAYINTAIFSPAGNIMYTLVKWSYNEETYESSNESYFIVLDKDGKQLSFMDLNKMFAYKENFWGVYNFLMDSKNNLYFVIENAVVVTDVNGTVLFEVSVGSDRYINNIYLDKNGDVLVLYYDYSNDSYRNILKKIDLNKRDLGDEVSLPSRVENYVYNLMPSNDPVYDFYFNDSSVLCAVDLKSGSVVEILNWINSDIDSNSMYNFVVI
ncbi:MAG: hypothetical protein FWF15_00540, partial [Oscillospiraceae bacterium]|nr:hypothetical protein [Oscillospiraceae bacterium]